MRAGTGQIGESAGSRSRRAVPRNRRQALRLAAGCPVTVVWEEAGESQQVLGRCLDISSGGARIEASENIPCSTHVHIRFLEELNLEAGGVVRHSNETGVFGVEFSQLTFRGLPMRGKRRSPYTTAAAAAAVVTAAVVLVLLLLNIPPWW